MHFIILLAVALSGTAHPASIMWGMSEAEALLQPKSIIQRSPLPTQTAKDKSKPLGNLGLSIPTLSIPLLSHYTLSMPTFGFIPQKAIPTSAVPNLEWPSSSPSYISQPSSWIPPPIDAPNWAPATDLPNRIPMSTQAPIPHTILITITRTNPSIPTNAPAIPTHLGSLVPQPPGPKTTVIGGNSSSSDFDFDD
jgi:hypothetical protein